MINKNSYKNIDIIFKRPEPMFDEVIVSVFYEGNILDFLIGKFGLASYWTDIKGERMLKNGVVVCEQKKKNYRPISFKPTHSVRSSLYPVLETLPPRRGTAKGLTKSDGKHLSKPAAMLSQATIVFDFEPDHVLDITEAKSVLLKIASVLLPKGELANIRESIASEGILQLATGGATPKDYTLFIDRYEKDEHGSCVKIKSPTWAANLKFKEVDDGFVPRLKVTMRGKALSRYIVNDLPRSLHVNYGTCDTRVEDFFDLARFDWERFEEAYLKICAKKPKFIRTECEAARSDAEHNRYVIEDKISAYHIVGILDSTELAQRVQDGEFLQPVQLFDE